MPVLTAHYGESPYNNGHAVGAVACGNDDGQAVVLEPLPSRLKARHQRVSLDGHGARLRRCLAMSRAVAP